MPKSGITLSRFIREKQKGYSTATGEFTGLIIEIGHAARIITREVRKAGLVDILGLTGKINVQGEEVQKLDEFAHHTIVRALDHTGLVCVMASEESDGVIPIPDRHPRGKYALNFDPLDGSSNIDTNASIGTIIGIHRKVSPGGLGSVGTREDLLRKGSEQIGAVYIIYGSSTILVYSDGHGVHEFTLDPSVGEFYLSQEDIRIPPRGKTYSVNEGNWAYWSDAQRRVVDYFKAEDKASDRPYGLRYIGSLVADFHRTLKKGGIFMYPGDRKNPQGKLRLLFECAPLAFMAQSAGGAAIDGSTPILGIEPAELHHRSPLYIGSAGDVRSAETILTEARAGAHVA
ncbi:MAG: class 1 fructose-bisphosphatase [Planctomycetes bacterium]|nr:class 1 fructose-bisphosphatase [Planctomycetota bacterium]